MAVVRPFLAEMELALGATTVAISRAGASALAEFAAMQTPAILIPFPAATDNHQFHNARAFEHSGSAKLLEQSKATPELLAQMILELVENQNAREKIRTALAAWHKPNAAEEIAENILSAMRRSADSRVHAKNSVSETRGQSCPRSNSMERQEFSIV